MSIYHTDLSTIGLDGNQSAIFARELEFIMTTTYDKLYTKKKFALLIPISNEVDTGAETYTYESWDMVGIMKIIARYSDNLPRSDVFAKKFTHNIHSLGGSFGYTIQEVRATAMAGKPLNARKADTVRQADEQAINRIAWNGDADAGLLGMLSQPNVPAATVPAGVTTTFVPWVGASSKNADEILTDLNNLVDDIVSISKEVHEANTVIMPIDQHSKLKSTPQGTGTDTTIMQYWLNAHPEIQLVERVVELNDVAPLPSGGGGPSDVAMAYDRDPNMLTLEIPQPFEMFAAQQTNLEFVVPAHSRIGSVVFYYPLSANIIEGI